jgi:hypothetical protein
MRRAGLVIAALVGLAARIGYAACDSITPPTMTPNLGLSKPVINACGWGTTTNANWSIVDSSVPCLNCTNVFAGTNTFNQPVIIGANKPLRLYDTSTHFIELRATTTVATTVFYLPAADGANGQFMMTDGQGHLSFASTTGGGASTLAVNKNGVQVSSPTVAINFLGPPFTVTLTGGSTSQVGIDPSSGTLQGNSFNQANQLVKLDGSTRLPVVDGSQLTNVSATNSLPFPAGATNYWNIPSTGTFPATYGVYTTSVTASTISATHLVDSELSAGQCVQTGAGGSFSTTGSACLSAGSYIYNTSSLQSGATFYVSSGTVNNELDLNGNLNAGPSTTGSYPFAWDNTNGVLRLGGGSSDPASWETINAGLAINALSIRMGTSTYGLYCSTNTEQAFSPLGAFNDLDQMTLTLNNNRQGGVLATRSQLSGPFVPLTLQAQDELGLGHVETIVLQSTGVAISTSVFIMGAQPILSTSTLQSGATFYVSSGTVAGQFSPTTIKWPDGTIQVSSPTAGVTPGGTGTQIQYKNGSSFGGVPGSSVTATGPVISSMTVPNIYGSQTCFNYNPTGMFMQTQQMCINLPGSSFVQPYVSVSTQADGVASLTFEDMLGNTYFETVLNSGVPELFVPNKLATASAYISGLTPSQFVQTDASKNLVSYDFFNASPTYNGQAKWTSASPSTFTALAVTGLGAQNCIGTAASGLLQAGTCGGGGSALAVATGSASGFTVPASSPTSVINFDSSTFKVSLKGGATAFVQLSGVSAGNYAQPFTSQTSVTLTHNLSTTSVIVQCFDNSSPPQQIGWNDLKLTDTNNATVTFANSQSGTCVVNAGGINNGGGAVYVSSQAIFIHVTGSWTTSNTTWTFVTGSSVTITPQSSSNKVRVAASCNAYSTTIGKEGRVTLFRNGANVVWDNGLFGLYPGNTGTQLPIYTAMSFTFIDSPATTSPVTYSIWGNEDSGGTLQLGDGAYSACTISAQETP